MSHRSEQGSDGLEWLDWLFDQNEGILRHEEPGNHGNQFTWLTQDSDTGAVADDFLSALLSGSESASGGSPPLRSPSQSDSGISEDPLSDQMDSPPRPGSPPVKAQCGSGTSPAAAPRAAPRTPCSVDLYGWEADLSSGWMGRTAYPGALQPSPLASAFPLTVKDLLLSGTQEPPQHPPQQCAQELVLNDDEKKLLVKEGVSLPSKLPLTKQEERILKKVRRKIRNKQSAQESRKKKKEYIDGLESRMANFNSYNQELQRKVFQLEKCNTTLMDQLRRLQALVMNNTPKSVQAGTCVMVLLLSFSLILFPSLRPFPDTKVSQGDFGPVRIHSRSLHSLQYSHVPRVMDHPLPSTTGLRDDPPPEEAGRDDVEALMGKMGSGSSDLGSVSLNQSYKGESGLFSPGDPITGHIATVTLDAYHRARQRPHADDM